MGCNAGLGQKQLGLFHSKRCGGGGRGTCKKSGGMGGVKNVKSGGVGGWAIMGKMQKKRGYVRNFVKAGGVNVGKCHSLLTFR